MGGGAWPAVRPCRAVGAHAPPARSLFAAIAAAVAALQEATNAGVRLVFGYLAGGPAPFDVTHPENGFVLALQGLPLILVVSVLSKVAFHYGVLQRLVAVFALILRRAMGVSGPLGVAAAANIFIGMVEAPLLVRPYVAAMTRSDLFATMSVGMATVAGTVMALYASLLQSSLPGAAGHILIASIISAPAALLIARLMAPPRQDDDAPGEAIELKRDTHSLMDAISQGTSDGLRLLVAVAAMLVVMVALVALANMILAGVLSPFGVTVTFEKLLGWAMAPLAFIIGIPAGEATAAGELIGVKTVLNEFLAYLQLAKIGPEVLSERSRLILVYALCGFANFGSLGIMTGGLIAMAPDRRGDILALAPKTLISGTLATLMTGAVIGALTWN